MTKLRDRLVVLLAAGFVLYAGPALATCGDDVGGTRVACRCGDVVVSDTRLQASDPVVSERCPVDGLIVRARAGASSIKLDLAGLAILGSGHGTGLRVISGGSEGAVVDGGAGAPGEIAGFGTGFRARGQRSVRELRNLSFVGNTRDGVVLRGAGTEVRGVSAERNGRDGMRVGGRGVGLSGINTQQNSRDGLRLTTSGAGADARDTVSAGNDGQQVRASKRTQGDGADAR